MYNIFVLSRFYPHRFRFIWQKPISQVVKGLEVQKYYNKRALSASQKYDPAISM